MVYQACAYFSPIKYKNNPRLKHNIVFIGDKGSGKTAMQNCWLNEHNDVLEQNKIFWVRCDGHKLYELWLNSAEIIEKKKQEGDLNGYLCGDES